MQSFQYESFATRVLFRPGALAAVADEAQRLGRRALVLTTPEQAALGARVATLLGPFVAGQYNRAVMHVPIEVVADARQAVERTGADMTVAVGGGSTIGLAKALALELGLPILAIPTTYAGSEMTPVWGLTESGVKRTGRDTRVIPRAVIYDAELTLTLPPGLSATSGINSMAHCVEALYTEQANPLTSMMAQEGIAALARSLPRVVRDPSNVEARSEAFYGAWLGGSVLGAVGMALHHKLCHTLGGSFNLPHAETHTIVLPHVLAYNARHAPEAMRRISAAMGGDDPAQRLFDLLVEMGTPLALKDIGMPMEGIERAVELATTNPYYNPAPIRVDALRKLLANAWDGKRPEPYLD